MSLCILRIFHTLYAHHRGSASCVLKLFFFYFLPRTTFWRIWNVERDVNLSCLDNFLLLNCSLLLLKVCASGSLKCWRDSRRRFSFVEMLRLNRHTLEGIQHWVSILIHIFIEKNVFTFHCIRAYWIFLLFERLNNLFTFWEEHYWSCGEYEVGLTRVISNCGTYDCLRRAYGC